MAKSFDALVRETTSKRTRQRAVIRSQELLGEMLLSEVRRLAGKSQQQLASAARMTQPSVSKLEKQGDMQISTLRKIVEALGGELELVARFPNHAVKIKEVLGNSKPRRSDKAASGATRRRRAS